MRIGIVLAIIGIIVLGIIVIWYRFEPKSLFQYSMTSATSERVEFKTKDNISIVGDYYPPAASSVRELLLLHMMPATRASWRALAEKMQAKGFHVLAIDLRGHGESQGGPDGYQNFSDAEHQASRLDVEAAAEFMKSRGVSNISLGGASIGANLALQYLAEHKGVRAAFLLSPGLNYRGVVTEPFVKKLSADQAVYVAASREDMRSSGQSAADMAELLFKQCRCKKEITIFDGADHGTAILEREPAFMDTLSQWLDNITR